MHQTTRLVENVCWHNSIYHIKKYKEISPYVYITGQQLRKRALQIDADPNFYWSKHDLTGLLTHVWIDFKEMST